MSNLTAKYIIDRNGKATTVHVKIDPNQKSKRRSFAEALRSRSIPPKPVQYSPIENGKAVVPWNGLPIQHEKRTFPNGAIWTVAPDGVSGASCIECKSFFRDDEIDPEDDASCSICGAQNRTKGRMESAVRADAIQFFDEQTTRNADWYHISVSPNWGEDITSMSNRDQPLVHAGTLAAAERRMENLVRENAYTKQELKFYRYKIRLKQDSKMAEYVTSDYDFDAPETAGQALDHMRRSPDEIEFYDSYELYGVTRYINEYESHGSMSLIMHPSSFEIVERLEL